MTTRNYRFFLMMGLAGGLSLAMACSDPSEDPVDCDSGDANCVCTLDEDDSATDDCVDGLSGDEGAACSCELIEEPEPEAEAEPEPEAEPPVNNDPPPAFRFVMVEDLVANPSGDFPGADVDAIGLIKSTGEEHFAQSFEEDTDIDCEGNLACDANSLLGAPDAVDPATGTCFGGGQPDASIFTALNAGFVIVQFSSVEAGDVTIENGDSVHVYEVGGTECGRFDDDAFRVSVSVADAITGDFKVMGEGGNGTNIVPVSGL